MAFLALVIIGCVTYSTLPVSLLPDIDIPRITVQVTEENMSSRELENTVTAPLRRQLMQVEGVDELRSETRDGSAIVSLTMDYGVNTDLAFIEANEKIDAVKNSLPPGVTRPKAAKASATDIPVLYLQMTLKDKGTRTSFLEMAEIAENVVRRRLEQLPEIAMVDMTGTPGKVLRITPKADLMASAGLTAGELEEAVAANNTDPGSMTVRDGYYEYNVAITNRLRTASDVEEIKIRKGDRIIRLGDVADVELTVRTPTGYSLSGGQRAVTLAVIKHGDESMAAMDKALGDAIDSFAGLYPDIRFSKTRNQTELLDYTISNLKQNLLLGLLLVFLLCVLFMRSARSAVIIGLSIIVGVILTFLLFYLFHVSINIISLAGLILAVGMMIDNSVIVTENIAQFRSRGESLADACAKGTAEMITPMLSSSLTTVAVFLPLVFMSGMAGAIFADQAFAITAGLAASYVASITLLPVLYYMMAGKNAEKTATDGGRYLKCYDNGMDFCFRHKWLIMGATLCTIPLCVLLFTAIRREKMPEIDSDETTVRIDWNESINLDENRNRVSLLLADSSSLVSSAFVGAQSFILSSDLDLSSTEAELYFKASSPAGVDSLRKRIARNVGTRWPEASVSFHEAGNLFDKVFSGDEAALEARLRSSDAKGFDMGSLRRVRDRVQEAAGTEVAQIPVRGQIDITVDRNLLSVYDVDYAAVADALRDALKGSAVSTLRSGSEYTPIEVSGSRRALAETIGGSFVRSRLDKEGNRTEIPLRSLVTLGEGEGLKSLTAGADGEYVALAIDAPGREEEVMEKVRRAVAEEDSFEVDFAGGFFAGERMVRELTVILLVSVMLMYFILCAQFGSFLQPLVILLEIPVDTFFALLTLMIFGQTLNIMSAIGVIVTCGIVVNDSILKLDAINDLRRGGTPLAEAIHIAGRRRLRPIIMTSLTTVFAMLPVLFTSDMGSELQRPLAIAMIGSMAVGTLVSIFVIPLFYRLIYRKHEQA